MEVEYKVLLTEFSGVAAEYTLIKSILYLKLFFGMRKSWIILITFLVIIKLVFFLLENTLKVQTNCREENRNYPQSLFIDISVNIFLLNIFSKFFL